jgi:2-polyprenyl-3-methyl-5-hydroxy-6-metoxy-1,4-benzoquinol methylase
MKTNISEINKLHDIDLYLYFYEEFAGDERTSKECEFIIRASNLEPQSKILDLACGYGRHSINFANNHFKVTGIDINRRFIERAEKDARARYDTPFSMQLYNYSELEELLVKHGLRITRLFGNWNGSEFNMDAKRIIAVIEHQ